MRCNAVIAVMLLLACQAVAFGEDTKAEPLTGLIDGKPWSYVAGSIIDDSDRDSLAVALFPEAKEDMRHDAVILAGFPKKSGTFQLGKDVQITFAAGPNANALAKRGVIIVRRIDDKQISAFIDASVDERNRIKGDFTLKVEAEPTKEDK